MQKLRVSEWMLLVRIGYGVYKNSNNETIASWFYKEQRVQLMMYKLHFVAFVPSTSRKKLIERKESE